MLGLGDSRLQSTLYTVHLLLVYTRMISSHLISRHINKEYLRNPWSNKGLKGIIVNRTCHSINGKSLEITLTVPLNICISSFPARGEGEGSISPLHSFCTISSNVFPFIKNATVPLPPPLLLYYLRSQE